MHITASNFINIGQTVAEILGFYGCPKMAAAAILDFRKFKFLPADTFERPNLRHCAKFHQDRLIRC